MNEGICADLVYATPGLYGPCIAFCEAQDCDPDWSLPDSVSVCKTSNQRILEIYSRERQPADPDMPCYQPPLPECPCFTLADLEQYFAPPWGACYYHQTFSSTEMSYLAVAEPWLAKVHSRIQFTTMEYSCRFALSTAYPDPKPPSVFIILSPQQEADCRALLNMFIDGYGGCQ